MGVHVSILPSRVPFPVVETIGDEVLRSAHWQQEIDDLAAIHGVPGAQVGLLAFRPDGSVDRRALVTGVTSLSTQVPVTPETLFQYGSITKIWTTTLVMQLVDEGRLDLDTRVVDILERFELSDHDAASQITIRQLLDHTSGIDGDVFTDTGDGDDCLAKYVDQLGTAVSVTEPGAHLSYCNAGFVVAGRIIEVLHGKTWDDVLIERLFQPLRLTHAITRAKDAPLFRTAVGHLKITTGSDDIEPTTTWMLPRSIGPAGLITGNIDSLLTFAAAHLSNGVGLAETRILSGESAIAMRRPQIDLTAVSSTQLGWGLGWAIERWGDQVSAAHGGATIGQIADLHTFPDQKLAIAVLTNSRGGSAMINDLHDLLADELNLTPTSPQTDPNAATADLSHIVGDYQSSAMHWRIAADHGRLTLTITKTATTEPDALPEPITPLGPNRFLVSLEGQPQEVSFVEFGDRQFLFFGRLLERTNQNRYDKEHR